MWTNIGIDFAPFPLNYLPQYLVLWYNYHKKLKIVEPMEFLKGTGQRITNG